MSVGQFGAATSIGLRHLWDIAGLLNGHDISKTGQGGIDGFKGTFGCVGGLIIASERVPRDVC